MKNLYSLINFEFRTIYKLVLGISVLLIAGQNLLLYLAGRDYLSGKYIPFEKLISISGAPVLFYICCAMLTACCVYNAAANYIGSKSIYTLMTLPQSRSLIFIAKVTSAAVGMLMLAASQVISIFTGYFLFASPISSVENGQLVLQKPVNGLFLAFVRSDFLRILFPLNLESLLSTVFISVSVLLAVFFVIFCVQSHRYMNMGISLINIILVIYVLMYRINVMDGWRKQNLYLYSLVFAGLVVYYIRQSIKWMDRGSILG